MDRKKILFILHGLKVGGIESTLLALLRNMDLNQYDVTLLLTEKSQERIGEVPKGIRIETLSMQDALFLNPLPWSWKKGLCFCHPFLALQKALISVRARCARDKDPWKYLREKVAGYEGAFDVAIDYDGFCKEYIVDKVKARRKAHWNHFHYSTLRKDQCRDRAYFAKMDYLVATCREGADALRDFFPEYKEKIQAIYSILDAGEIRRKAMERAPDLPEKAGRAFLCSVGRLEAQKDFSFAIQTAEILSKKGFPFFWYIIGEGSQRKMLQKEILQKGLEGKVALYGKRRNPFPYIKASDLYVQTSNMESPGIAVEEAMVLCKPVVVVDADGLREYAQEGQHGVMSERVPEELAKRIMEYSREARERTAKKLGQRDWSGKESLAKIHKIIGG